MCLVIQSNQNISESYTSGICILLFYYRREIPAILLQIYTQFIFNMLTSRKFELKNENLEPIKACLCNSIFFIAK